MTTRNPRVLIADDQADVIEALRLLLKAGGLRGRSRDLAGRRVVRGRKPRLRRRAHGPELHARHDIGQRRAGPAAAHQGAGQQPARHRDDRVGQHRGCGRGDAARRARLRREAVGQRAAARRRCARRSSWAARCARPSGCEGENRMLRRTGLPQFVAESRAMQPVLTLMERVGPSDANVLITGEHGTGKEVVARWLHAASPRANKALVTVNAGGLSEGVFESELFGHVKGAFTDAKSDRVGCFELADGGTLFLDEIGEPAVQAAGQAAARAADRRVPARRAHRRRATSTCACSRRPTSTSRSEVAEGRFREDLLYRLNTVEIPPAAAARAPGRRHRAGHAFPAQHERQVRAQVRRLRSRSACRRCSSTAGRATSASSSTWSSARS